MTITFGEEALPGLLNHKRFPTLFDELLVTLLLCENARHGLLCETRGTTWGEQMREQRFELMF